MSWELNFGQWGGDLRLGASTWTLKNLFEGCCSERLEYHEFISTPETEVLCQVWEVFLFMRFSSLWYLTKHLLPPKRFTGALSVQANLQRRCLNQKVFVKFILSCVIFVKGSKREGEKKIWLIVQIKFCIYKKRNHRFFFFGHIAKS